MPTATLPPSVRLHEMAVLKPTCAAAAQTAGWWSPMLAGEDLIRNPKVTVLGRVSHGKSLGRPHQSSVHRSNKTALMRWLYLDAMRRSDRPVVVFDEVCKVVPFDLSSVSDRATDPFACAPAPTGSATGLRGW